MQGSQLFYKMLYFDLNFAVRFKIDKRVELFK